MRTIWATTWDFAFPSGATKSPHFPPFFDTRSPPDECRYFAFPRFCEMLVPQFAPGDTNVDTGGEFPSAADRPELGQDNTRWVRETASPDAPDEFATSVNSRVTRGHLDS